MRISDLIKGPRRIRRLAHIASKLAAHGLGFLLSKLRLKRYLGPLKRLPSGGKSRAGPDEMPARFANVLEELGPTFVKFGQMLSTRPDLLPHDYIVELRRICHHVAPFPGSAARSIVEEELGAPVEEVFASFSNEPRASGSIAQVHDAVLHDGAEVVVKVRRPGIRKTIEDDLAIIKFLASRAETLEELKPFRLRMLADEFARTVMRELNLLTEAAYTHRFHSCMKDEDRLEMPEVYWDYTTENVITLTRISGPGLTEIDDIEESYQDKKKTARTLLDVFLKQFFGEGVFHSDPHPGNIVLLGGDRIGLLDMGQVGTIDNEMRSQLGICIVALGNEQMELAAEVLAEVGAVPHTTSRQEFCSEVAALMDRYYSIPVERINFQKAFTEVMDIVRRYGVMLPRDFVLVSKTLATISGLVMRLDPQLNVAELAAPYGRKLMYEKLSPRNIRRALTRQGYHLSNLLRHAPGDLRELITKLHRGMLEFTIRHEGFDKAVSELDRTGNRLSMSILLAAVIMASTSLLTSAVGPKISLFGWETSALGFSGLMLGMILGLWLILGILRSGRL